MATTLSTTIQCPAMCCTCGGAEQVEALTSPTAKTVRITACASLLAQGWRGHQLAVAKTDVATLARYGVTA